MGAKFSSSLFVPTSGSTVQVETVGFAPTAGFQDLQVRNFTTSGTATFGSTATALTVFRAANGSSTIPSYSFTSETTLGIYRSGAAAGVWIGGTFSSPGSGGASSEVFGAASTNNTGTSVTILGNTSTVGAGGNNATIVGAASSSTTGTSVTIVGQGATNTTGNSNSILGAGSTCGAASSTNVVVGQGSSTGTASNNIVVGQGASVSGSSNLCVLIGQGATQASAVAGSTVVGAGSVGGGTSSILLGRNSSCGGATISNSIIIGSNSTNGVASTLAIQQTAAAVNRVTTAADAVFGTDTIPYSEWFFGRGRASATAGTITLHATDANGTDIAGSNLLLAGGAPTGSGAGGEVRIQTAAAGATGTTLRSLVTKMIVYQNGSFLHSDTGTLPSAITSTNANFIMTYDVQSTARWYAANASGAGQVLQLGYSRGTTASPTTIISGDVLGQIDFPGYIGPLSGYATMARIYGAADGTPTDNSSAPAQIILQTVPSGSLTGINRVAVRATGTVNLNASGSALATGATDGFTYIPSCAGTPAGVPTAITGAAPIVVDSTNNLFYVYTNAVWRATGALTLAQVLTNGNTSGGSDIQLTTSGANFGQVTWGTGGTYAAGATSEIYGPTDTGMFISAGTATAGNALTLTGGAATAGAGGLTSLVGGAGVGTDQNAGGATISTGNSSGTGTGTVLIQTAPAGASGAGANTATTVLTINDVATTATIPFRGANGSTTAPTYSYSAETNTGFYRFTTGATGYVSVGTLVFEIGQGGAAGDIQLRSTGTFGFSGAGISAASDLFITRRAASQLSVDTATSTDGGGGIFHREIQVDRTADLGITAAASNTLYTNTGAAGTVIFTLPTAAVGLRYTFIVNAVQSLQVTAGASTTIRLGATVSAAAGNMANNALGSSVTLVAVSTTQWMATAIVGTWTVT